MLGVFGVLFCFLMKYVKHIERNKALLQANSTLYIPFLDSFPFSLLPRGNHFLYLVIRVLSIHISTNACVHK